MATETEYYTKILQAWITKMKNCGFSFKVRESLQYNGIELICTQKPLTPDMCLIVDYDNPEFNVDSLYDRLHKLELLLPKLGNLNKLNQRKTKTQICSTALSYFIYNYYTGPYLIGTSSDLPHDKRYFTYIENGKFKTVIGNA